MTPLEYIKSKCIEANPEIKELKAYVCGNCGFDEEQFYRPIRLADVLLALEKHIEKEWLKSVPSESLDSWQSFLKSCSSKVLERWNLKVDAEDQTPETIEFIATLLGKKE